MISVKDFLMNHKQENKTLSRAIYRGKTIDEILKFEIKNFSQVFIKSKNDYVEMQSFYHESVHEFFEKAFFIKLNGELLYSGYKLSGEDKCVYIKGKYDSLDECLNKIKNTFKDVEFRTYLNNPNSNKDQQR